MRGRYATLCFWGFLLAASCAVGEGTLDLAEGWRLAPDPDNAGLDQGWHLPDVDDASWAVVRGGLRWEDQGFPTLDGAAWYRRRIAVPEEMRAERVWLVLGGINDSGVVYWNGEKVASFGDEEAISVARTPVVVDVTARVRWGDDNVLAIRVFDWGNSGGLAVAPCLLTTDMEALPLRSLFPFVPGFDGQSSVVGIDPAALGVDGDAGLRFSVAMNDGVPALREAEMTADREGRAMAVAAFDLDAKEGDRIRIAVEVSGSAASSGGPLRLERTYTWPAQPAWPGRYGELRVLNNFVTELLAAASVPGTHERRTFLNPREGWVFLRVQGADAAVAHVDDETEPLVWRRYPETGALEAMRYLEEGDHVLRLDEAQGARLDVRAVPEIAFCYWPTRTVMSTLPPRDRAFAERFIFPNANTLLTHDDMTEEEFDAWRAEGRWWLNNSSLPGLDDDDAPTADAVYADWASNASVTRPGYAGIIVDEFLSSSSEHYAAWTSAAERLHAHPSFQGQTYYAWVVDTFQHPPGLAFMRRLYDLGGRFAWERYLHEEPTEEVAVLRMYDELGALEDWEALMPGLKERLLYCLGSFSIPWCSLNIQPGVHYLPFMDRQFQMLATDPLFFGSRGIFQWAAHYTDDDVLRYAQNLYRHYCIEGHRTPLADLPYRLTHIENPDFTEGLEGWRVETTEAEGVEAGSHHGLGKIQGRWASADVGDACAVLTRSEDGPNRIGQTVRDLEPGRLYSMKVIAADLDRLDRNEEVGLWPEIDGADVVAEGSFRIVMPSSYTLDLEGFSRERRAYTTYVQVMFRPRSTSAELTFSDWKDGQPAGRAHQRIGFNFVEIQPYYE